MNRSARAALAAIAGMALAAGVRVASVWDRLPPVMASHFGPSGRPDGWMSREGYAWTMALLGGGTTLLLALAPLWLRKIPPSLINMPHRDYWLAPERREASLARLGAWTAWFGALTFALLAGVNELALRANLTRGPLPTAPFLVMLGAYFAAAAAMTIWLYRAFRPPRHPGSASR